MPDGQYGSENEDGEWTGMVKELIDLVCTKFCTHGAKVILQNAAWPMKKALPILQAGKKKKNRPQATNSRFCFLTEELNGHGWVVGCFLPNHYWSTHTSGTRIPPSTVYFVCLRFLSFFKTCQFKMFQLGTVLGFKTDTC